MENENDYPQLGKDIQSWSELDSRLPILDLDIELFRRNNVSVAPLVILSGLLNADEQLRKKILALLNPSHFSSKSLTRYFYERMIKFFEEYDVLPISEMEKWILEYSFEIWRESPPGGRMFFGNNLTLRQIINFRPTEEQIFKAIELRQIVIQQEKQREKKGGPKLSKKLFLE